MPRMLRLMLPFYQQAISLSQRCSVSFLRSSFDSLILLHCISFLSIYTFQFSRNIEEYPNPRFFHCKHVAGPSMGVPSMGASMGVPGNSLIGGTLDGGFYGGP